jgi:hypothetical protein
MENSNQGQTQEPQTSEVTYWSYCEPSEDGRTDVLTTLTEKQILDYYFPYWCTQMVKAGRGDFVNEHDCILDWAVVHWAVKTDKDGRQL